ncbi:MAG: response regulator [Anaerolineales bacterium]
MTEKIRALIVEDEASWQQILEEILEDMGLSVDVCANAAEALEWIQRQAYRLAVLDLSLGGRDHHNQDGLQVLAAIRRHDPGCAAIILTGYATVELAVSVIQDQGAYTLLQKESFKIAAFRQQVQQALALKPPFTDHEQPMISPETEDHPVYDRRLQPGRACVVEDDPGWRSLFAELLQDAGYAVDLCSSAVEALGVLKKERHTVAVIDLSLSSSLDPEHNLDGYQLLETTSNAGIMTIVVSGYASFDRIQQAYQQYDLFACLEKQSFERAAFLDTLARLEAARPVDARLELLTGREKEVLDFVARGLTNKEIAQRLFVSTNTVKKHLKSIFEKLEVNNRAAASAWAISAGFSVEP